MALLSLIISIIYFIVAVFIELFSPNYSGFVGPAPFIITAFIIILLGFPGIIIGHNANAKSKITPNNKNKIAKISLIISYLTICFVIIITILKIDNDRNKKNFVFKAYTQMQIESICTALLLYKLDCGAWPSESNSLNALLNNPSIARWSGPYLVTSTEFVDKWGNNIKYRFFEESPIVYSAGPDEKYDTDDDIKYEL